LTIKGHAAQVNSVSFSPDGIRLASASGDKTVKVWDVATGQEMLTLKGHNDVVLSVSFSPDGTKLASASIDKTVKVWDAATGQELLTLKGHNDFVLSVSFSTDGKRLASASADRTLKVWEAATGQELLTLKGHDANVYSVSFSPDGKRLASGSNDGTVKLWDSRPWTPELRAQSPARGLLTLRRRQVASLDALQEVIRSDQTISDQVRQQALDWSPLFWTSRPNPVALLEELGARILQTEQGDVVGVNLADTPTITDVGLVHLVGLTKLERLSLSETQITDAGLIYLKGLSGLQNLSLSGTQVTDAGLVHLKGLTKLQMLHLGDTQITDAGVAELQQALPNCRIRTIAATRVTGGRSFIKKYDKDFDGKVSQEELKTHPDTPKQLKSQFDEFWPLIDTNGDGMIDVLEADVLVKRTQGAGR
ncbi:MAG: hypothetical protein VX346_18080, partial [Planctomycetota bacterium]|nr:hypothetical protein [Planctomycetota bacterium]